MSFVKMLGAVVCVLAVSISMAFARQATEAEMKALHEAVQVYKTVTEKGDVDGIMAASIPPKMFAEMFELGKSFGQTGTQQQMHERTRELFAKMMQYATFSDVAVALDQAQAKERADGTPYFIVPYAFTLKADGVNKRIKQDLIAILDDGRWYLITLSSPLQKLALDKTYPGLEKLEMNPPVVTDLN